MKDNLNERGRLSPGLQPLMPYAVAVSATALAAALAGALSSASGDHIFAFYYFATALVAVYGHARAAALTMALSVVSAYYGVVRPYGSFFMTPEGALALLLFVLASGATIVLVERLKREQRTVREAEDLFGKAFHANPAGLAISRASDGRYVEMNDTFGAITGYTRQETIGHTAIGLGLVPAGPRGHDVVEPLEGGVFRERAFVFTNHAGEERHVLVSSELIGLHGEPHFVSIFNDITERKHVEETLHRQAMLLANAQRIGRMGSWSLDLRNGRLTWPEATCDLFGITTAQFDGTFGQFERFILPEDQPVYRAATDRVSPSAPSFEAEYRIRRPDGAVRWMYERGHVAFDGAGTAIVRTGMVMDISEQRIHREQLAHNAALLRTAGRVARLGGWTLQLPERTLTWSDENCAIHEVPAGYKPTFEEGVGYYPPESRADVIRHVEACERDGTPYDFELPKITAKGRSIWVRSIGEAVRDAEGRIVGLQGAFQDVSDRRKAADALRESEAELRTLAETMPQMVWMTGSDGANSYVNQRWTDYTGLSRGDSNGRSWNSGCHPEDRQRVSDGWQKARATGVDYSVECRLRRADDCYRWMLVRALAIRDRTGQIAKWIGTCTDVDDLKQAQEAIGMQARMLDQIGQAVLATDAGGHITYANRFAGELYGWEPADMLGRTIAEVTGAQTAPEQAVEILAYMRGGKTWSGEFLVRRRDGGMFPALVTDSPVLDDRGHVVGVIGTSIDVSARKQAEEEGRQKDALIRIAGRITRTGGWAIDMPDQRVFWSDEVFDILEYPRGRAPSLAEALAFYPDPWRAALVAALDACGRNGTPVDLEVEILTATGGRKWVRVFGEAQRHADGSIRRMEGAFQDITERRHLEQQYLRAQRMESIGTLAGGIAHDLNNVLAPILLAIGLLQQDEEDPARLRTLAAIEASARRGAAMIGRVLAFARGMEGQRVEVPVTPLVRDLTTIVRETFPKNIVCNEHLSPNLWTLQADPTQIHQVLLNLCVNARDAMPAGGQIAIMAKNVVIDGSFAARNIDASVGRYVTIEIEDTGSGIPKAIIDKIFDPFFTTKEMGKGTGLGLATSLAIVKSHEGFMRVYSEPGRTRFQVCLPAQRATAPPPPPVTAAIRPRGRGETVLVIDDEPLIRQIARRTLEAYGYRVLLAEDGVQALAIYEQHRAEIAVVLTDMMMPVMSGAATIHELVRINPQVRIICASGLALEETVTAPGARIMDFLAKPYAADTLLNAISVALAHE